MHEAKYCSSDSVARPSMFYLQVTGTQILQRVHIFYSKQVLPRTSKPFVQPALRTEMVPCSLNRCGFTQHAGSIHSYRAASLTALVLDMHVKCGRKVFLKSDKMSNILSSDQFRTYLLFISLPRSEFCMCQRSHAIYTRRNRTRLANRMFTHTSKQSPDFHTLSAMSAHCMCTSLCGGHSILDLI